ncbi:hypothetical protein F5X99DRAFT_102308 [Biscogniauxia marginata]|nr:hypothetical protein F5X99DRAFT_102308 [Biscogniauxia marginata]
MASLQFDDPAVTGYSACWQGRILTFHAHTENENASLYQDAAKYKYAVWIYIPLDPGEAISGVWRRLGIISRSVTILFKTNKNRVTMVGPHLPSWRSRTTWSRIFTPTNGKTRFYFNDSPDGICQIATDSPAIEEVVPTLGNSSPSPNKTGIGEFFYSSASLENVMEIVPCRKMPETDSPIIGLLIRYSTGPEHAPGRSG